jgi:CHAT domain-containing protein/tetratricopeptide (TPR) repeat protein
VDAAAARWLDDAHAAPALTTDDERRALAWALKEHAYARIYAEPSLARAAATRVRVLAGPCQSAEARNELHALADWLDGAADAGQGEAARAVTKLDAAGLAFEALGAQAHAAASQVPKIAVLAMLGRHDEALACAERTLARFAALGDEQAAGKVEINLGSMLLRQDRYAESAAHYRRAAVRFARVGDRQHSVMADIGLAGALTWQFEFDEAMRIYERADARVRSHGLAPLQGVIDASRGLLELHRGRLGPALRWLEAALAAFERHGPPQRVTEARMDLAAAYLAVNLLPEAQALFEQAIAECIAQDAPVEQAWASAQLGLVLARQGHDDRAQQLLAAARGLFEQQGNGVGAACIDSHAAGISLRRDLPELALLQAQPAADLLADAGMRGWQLEAQLLAARANAGMGRRDEAWSRFQAIGEQASGLPLLRARCLTGQALLLRQRGDDLGALQRLEEAAALFETQQAALPGDEFRTAFAADMQATYDALVELALDDARAGQPARLLVSMERQRARALSLGLAEGAMAPAPSSAREPLHWLARQWEQAVAGGDAERAAAIQARVKALEAQSLETHRRAEAARPAAGIEPPPPFAVATLQAELDHEQALVEYAWIGQRLAIMVVRRQRLHYAAVDAQGIDAAIEQLRFQIDSLRFGAPALRRHAAQMGARVQAHLQTLHRRVWAPIAGAVRDAKHVVVVPHRALHYLPWCALHDGEAALLDRHAISLAPSAALWLAAVRRDARPPRRAVVAGLGGEALPHVRDEVASVAAAFGDGATVLQEGEVTLDALQRALHAAPGADLLHLACHGQFRADSPYFSSLQLADGTLTLRDASRLALRGARVTLSACETGLSRIAPGDELLGLVRGFLLAGAPSVLATLWTVDDAGTARLMRRYCQSLIDGQAPAQALREAQLGLREQQSHPYFWAPFALHGQA